MKLKCEICGKSNEQIINILGHKICVKCMGFYAERTRRGPIKPKPYGPMDWYLEHAEELPEKIKEWTREPEILEREFERMKEEGEMYVPPIVPEKTPEIRSLTERIREKLTEAFSKVKEALDKVLDKIKEWLGL